MSRTYSPLSKSILNYLADRSGSAITEIYLSQAADGNNKPVYDTLFRLVKAGLVEFENEKYRITEAGSKEIEQSVQKRDGVWKLVIFDIPEKDRYVRNFLRQRLKLLGFKKWQNNIWVSPYVLDKDIEKELKELAGQYFVRLIKTTEINYLTDLEQLFA